MNDDARMDDDYFRLGSNDALFPRWTRQPRHFHCGPDENEDRPRAALYRDALHSVYSFLSLQELMTASLASTVWYTAASNLKSRGATMVDATDKRILSLVQSPLRHHVTEINTGWTDAEDEHETPGILLLQSLLLLKINLPQLQLLRARLILDGAEGPLIFPPGLTSIDLLLNIKSNQAEVIDSTLTRAIKDLVREAPQLMKVNLFGFASGQVHCFPAEAIARLATLTYLTDLSIDVKDDQATFAHLRSIPHLKQLDIGRQWTVEPLQLFTDSDSPRIIEQLGYYGSDELTVDATTAPLVARLPSLTILNAEFHSNPDLLSHLPRLTNLRMECTPTLDLDLTMQAIACCPRLTTLNLISSRVTGAQLCTLLPRLPQLAHLTLGDCAALDSLACLSQATSPHLQRTLRSLHLWYCSTLCPSELRHLRALTALVTLRVERCCSIVIDPLTRLSMTPGSSSFVKAWWPNLQQATLL